MTFKINSTNATDLQPIITEPENNGVAQMRLRETYREYSISIVMLELRAPNQFTSPRDAEPFWADCGITITGEYSDKTVQLDCSSHTEKTPQQISRYAQRYYAASVLAKEVQDRLNGVESNAAYIKLERHEIIE